MSPRDYLVGTASKTHFHIVLFLFFRLNQSTLRREARSFFGCQKFLWHRKRWHQVPQQDTHGLSTWKTDLEAGRKGIKTVTGWFLWDATESPVVTCVTLLITDSKRHSEMQQDVLGLELNTGKEIITESQIHQSWKDLWDHQVQLMTEHHLVN